MEAFGSTVIALAGVIALAVVTLRLLPRRGRERGLVRVVARVGLEPRRALYVIEAAGRYLLVGVGDGPMTTLAELDALAVRPLLDGEARGAERSALGGALKRVLGSAFGGGR